MSRAKAPIELDKTDLKMLDALQRNGRLTNADLAEKVGKSTGYIYGRLKLCSLVDPAARDAWPGPRE